jgi:hypothetical protein
VRRLNIIFIHCQERESPSSRKFFIMKCLVYLVSTVTLWGLMSCANVTKSGRNTSSSLKQTCDMRLQKAEMCVNKMLILFDPDVSAFDSQDMFNSSYCQ